MSLINDALQRAQKDVNRGSMKSVPGNLMGTPRNSHNKGPFLLVLTVVVLIGILGWAVALLVAFPADEAEGIAPAPQTGESRHVPDLSLSEPLDLQPVVEPRNEEPLPLTPETPEAHAPAAIAATENPPEQETAATSVAPVQENGPTAEETIPAAEESPPTAVATNTGPPAAAETTLPVSDLIVFNLKQMDITAIMGDGKNTRIMVGGQIYTTGELVDLELKLRFAGKEGGLLYFTDENGRKYEKRI